MVRGRVLLALGECFGHHWMTMLGQAATLARGGRAAADVLRGRRRIYYGWWLLAWSVVAMAIGSGLSAWSYGLYVDPLESEFGWSRAEVSLGFSAALLVSGLSGPLVGWWVDARGPRSAIIIGSALTAASFLLLATTNALWQWYVYQGVGSVFRMMMFFIPFQALISRWFDRKRGVALSILATGFSLGGFVIVPLMRLVIDRWGWDGSFVFSAIMTAVVYLPIGVFVIRNSPADVGALIDGDPRTVDTPAMAAPPRGIPLRRAIRTPLFWLLAIGLMLFFYGMFGWLVHQLPFYESEGISRGSAALIVSLAAGAGIFSRLAFGVVADRVRRFEYVAMALTFVLAGAMTVLTINAGPVGIAVFLVFWLIGTGGGPMMEALLLTRAFGVAYFGTILGAVVVVETVGQILSPTIAGAIFDARGSYDWALVMYIGTFLTAFGFFFIASRLPQPRLDERQ